MKIGIIGYGDLGRQLRDFLLQENPNALFTAFDDYASVHEGLAVHPFEACMDAAFADHLFYIGLGYKHLNRRALLAETLSGRTLPVFVHPSVTAAPSVDIGAGSVVYPGTILDHHVQIGKAVLINNGVIVSHDSEIGEATYISPGVVICGQVRIGKRCFIGAGTVISNGVSIGDDVIVGIGSVITRDVPSGKGVIGNPMRFTENLNLR